MKRFAMIAAGLISVAVAACNRTPQKEAAVTKRPTTADSASGDVAQYALMRNSIGWITDSNLVALASIVNTGAVGLARMEAQEWTSQALHSAALEIIRDHAALQTSIDSLAERHHIPSQMPAIADSIRAPYDSIVASQTGLALADREARFADAISRNHAQAMKDFAALAGNATDPDLRALFASRALLMEQTHVARLKLLVAAQAKADSVKAESLATAKQKPRKP